MRKVFALSPLSVFIFSLLVFNSCQKGPDDTISENNCYVSKAYYYDDNGGIYDSLLYTYTDNKLTKASNAEAYVTLEYTAGRITRRNVYLTVSQNLDAYNIVTYNNEGLITSIKFYTVDAGQEIQYSQYDFSYANGNLITFDVKEYDYNTNQLELYARSSYTYTGDNITKCITTGLDGGTGVDVDNYFYDTNENSFAKNNLLVDLAFMEGIDGPAIPLFISANNVIRSFDGYSEILFNYKSDNKGNMEEFYIDNELAIKYLYNCK